MSTQPYADLGSVEALVLATGERKVLRRNAHYGRYLDSGHLLWISRGTAFTAPFDASRLELTGEGRPMFDDVERNDVFGSAHLDVAGDGTLIYVERKGAGLQSTLQWLDPGGKLTPIVSKPGGYSFPVLSPDGKQLAYLQQIGTNRDIWIHDLVRDVSRRLTLTPDENEYVFVWTPDGKSLIYSSEYRLKILRVDSSAEPVTFFEHKQSNVFVHAMSPDGKFLAFCIQGVATGNDLWMLPLEWTGDRVKAGEPKAFQATAAVEIHAGFSPDVKWLAFSSDESGNSEVYARSFPDGAGKVQISIGGGGQPIWLPSAKELYYSSNEGQPMVVSYEPDGNGIRFSKPRLWASQKLGINSSLRRYSVSADGKRLAVTLPEASQMVGKNDKVVFLENFTSELRRSAAK